LMADLVTYILCAVWFVAIFLVCFFVPLNSPQDAEEMDMDSQTEKLAIRPVMTPSSKALISS